MNLGKYELVRKLATGGMAEVFLARLPGARGFSKELVVKRILPHLAEDSDYVDMFLAEAQLAAKLSHPNLVQIFEFGEVNGAYFIAMERVDGIDLRTLLRMAYDKQQRIAPALCCRIVAQACDALQYVHDFADPETGAPLHLIHRDVSPDNLLISKQGVVKVVDFGIAKPTGIKGKTRTGLVRGKLQYMPPEQLRAERLDRRVDVYALGATLFELVAGTPPFDDPNETVVMQAILEMPVPYIKLRRQDAPGELQEIFEKALAKKKEDRYATCHELAADLELFVSRSGVPTTTQHLAQLFTQVPNGSAGAAPVLLQEKSASMLPTGGNTTDPEENALQPQRLPEPKSHQFSHKWEAPSYGLDDKGNFHGRAQFKKDTPNPLEFQPFRSDEAPLEFARPIGQARKGTLAKDPPKPKKTRRKSGILWILMLLVLGGGGYVGFKLFVPKDAFVYHPPPPPPEPGALLFVNSEPAGADVYIGESKVGQTPWAVENRWPRGQEIHVSLRMRGYRTWTGSFVGGKKATVSATLRSSR